MKRVSYKIKEAVFNGKTINLYVSTKGEVFDENMVEKQYYTDNRGYIIVYNKSVRYHVHRLVAETFIPNPYNLPTVNHKNGDKSKNGVNDLEWMSYSDNNKHAIDSGLRVPPKGEKHQNATFTNEQVHEICKLLEDGVLYDDIIDSLKIEGDEKEIRRRLIMIKNGYAWKSISSEYNIPTKRNSSFDKYTPEQLHIICKAMSDGETDWKTLASLAGLEQTSAVSKMISMIRMGRYHKDIVSQYNIPKSSRTKYSEDQIRYICYLIERSPDNTAKNILTLANIPVREASKNLIYNLKSRKIYNHITKDFKW